MCSGAVVVLHFDRVLAAGRNDVTVVFAVPVAPAAAAGSAFCST